jgi:hypothetical protein
MSEYLNRVFAWLNESIGRNEQPAGDRRRITLSVDIERRSGTDRRNAPREQDEKPRSNHDRNYA